MAFIIFHFIAALYLIWLGYKFDTTGAYYYVLLKVVPIVLGIYMLGQALGFTATASFIIH